MPEVPPDIPLMNGGLGINGGRDADGRDHSLDGPCRDLDDDSHNRAYPYNDLGDNHRRHGHGDG
jgi:hypothetical protein